MARPADPAGCHSWSWTGRGRGPRSEPSGPASGGRCERWAPRRSASPPGPRARRTPPRPWRSPRTTGSRPVGARPVPRPACSRCTGSCTDRSPRCAGRRRPDRRCRGAGRPRAPPWRASGDRVGRRPFAGCSVNPWHLAYSRADRLPRAAARWEHRPVARRGLSSGRLIVGVVLILLGVLFLLANTTDLELGDFFDDLWPVFLIGFGLWVTIASRGRNVVGLVLLFLGIGFQLSQLDVIEHDWTGEWG